MKKLFVLFLILVMIITVLTGCSSVEYRMYYVPAANSTIPPSQISGIPIEREHGVFDDILFFDGDEEEKQQETIIEYIDEDAPKTFEFQFGENKYEMTYENSYQNVFSQSENSTIKRLGYYHSYILPSENGSVKARLTVFKENFQVRSFYLIEEEKAEGTYTEEMATKIAQEEIERLYSKNIFKQYDFFDSYLDTNKAEYVCVYKRMVHDYETDDEIRVNVDKQGKITGFYGVQVGMFDNLTDDVSKRQIDKAAKTLKKTLESDTTVITSEKIYLDFDIHGTLYVRAMLSEVNENREVYATSIYWINVN